MGEHIYEHQLIIGIQNENLLILQHTKFNHNFTWENCKYFDQARSNIKENGWLWRRMQEWVQVAHKSPVLQEQGFQNCTSRGSAIPCRARVGKSLEASRSDAQSPQALQQILIASVGWSRYSTEYWHVDGTRSHVVRCLHSADSGNYWNEISKCQVLRNLQ